MDDATTGAATRVCRGCGNEKPEADFRLSRTSGRLSPVCWVCRWAAARSARERMAALPPDPFEGWAEREPAGPRLTHVCRKCGREKPLPEFPLKRATGQRYSPCRACLREKGRRYYAANRARVLAKYKDSRTPEARARRRARYARCARKSGEREAVRNRTKRLRVLGVLTLNAHCSDCGGLAVEVHHETYGDVCALISLCHACHMARHYRVWRKTGGGPVRYPHEYEEPEGGQ